LPHTPDDSRFLKACRSQPTDVTPVWFMRQAGRYLPEYRALRQRHSLLELCHKPELAAQVTLQPVERLGVDAAILFADILLPFEPLGLGLSFSAGEGPQITRPIREAGQVLELPPVDPATDLAYVMDAARAAAQALPPNIPLIGFAGAPFTLAPACRKEPSIRRAAPSPARGTRASSRSTRARCWAVRRRFRSLPIGSRSKATRS